MAGGAVMSSLARDGAEEAASVAGDDAGQAAQDARPSCGGESFTAATAVLLASGKTIAISRLKTGDKVKAVNTKSGKAQAETVTAVLIHHDTDLYDLTIKTARGTEIIHTTSNHLFWDPSLNYGWIPANHLKPGIDLQAPDGQTAVAFGGSRRPSVTAGCGTSPSPATTITTSCRVRHGSASHPDRVDDGGSPRA